MKAPQIDEAEGYILQGLKILDDLETKPGYAVGCFNLGELYMVFGRKEKALENLRRSEEMFSRMGMDHWLARARDVLARL
jgi:tetratricopeptide (TPR) repeat protein